MVLSLYKERRDDKTKRKRDKDAKRQREEERKTIRRGDNRKRDIEKRN
jgi:hypothetical protein